MFSDIVKALELLLKGIPGIDDISGKRKYRKLTKRLLRLFIDLEQLVATGNELLVDIRSQLFDEHRKEYTPLSQEHWYQTSRWLVEKQLVALSNVSDAINEEPLHSVLKVYVPSISDIAGSFQRSGKFDELRFLLSALTDIRDADAIGALPLPKAVAISQQAGGEGRVSTLVYALPEHLETAQKTLKQIGDCNEDLRALLVETFDIKDLI